jgi:hypothetical protein
MDAAALPLDSEVPERFPARPEDVFRTGREEPLGQRI